MHIKIVALRFMQLITFLTILILAGLFHIIWKDFVLTLAILGVAIIYLVLQIKMPFNLNSEEKNRAIIRITLLCWILILNLLFSYVKDTSYGNIWIYLIWIPLVLLLLLEWRTILESLSRFQKFIKLVIEYYLLKYFRD